jgi:hypothetical protein
VRGILLVCASCLGAQGVAEAIAAAQHGGDHPSPCVVHIDAPEGGHALVLRCRLARENCGRPQESRHQVPPYLIGAMTLAFHSAHEGHPLEIELDGQVIYPAPKESPA